MGAIRRAALMWGVLLWMFARWLAQHLGLRRLWAWARRRPYRRLPNEAIVREAFEILGPTYLKLGQLIASSPGLFPTRYATEFQRCLDQVPPFPLARVRAILAQELGRPVSEVFESFEEEPLGSASIAQVHGAVLRTGERVVAKVQRPGIARKVDGDLWWMRRGAWVAERLFEGARMVNAVGVIEDFDRTIHEELDFALEASHQREFNQMMAAHRVDDVRAPEPVDGLVTRRVLVMERFDGFKADDVTGMAAAGIDTEHFLRRGLRAWLMTVVLHGFFHGDAHAGNLMLLPLSRSAAQVADSGQGPAVGFLDFGIIGRFDDLQRQQVLRYVLAFAAQDYAALADVMVEIGAVDEERLELPALVADLDRVYSPLIEKNLTEIKYEEILPDIMSVGYRYGVRLPREFLLILKQLLYFDRFAKLAAPNLNVFSDFGLVDFLFTPDARAAGLDFNEIMPLLQRLQARVGPAPGAAPGGAAPPAAGSGGPGAS